jgi:xanthine dehydrogenase small subunit
MSLFTLYHDDTVAHPPTRGEIDDRLAGNLCRCTGYRPIVAAAAASCADAADDAFTRAEGTTAGLLQFLADRQDIFIGDADEFFAAPRTLEGVASLYRRHPDATIVAGATDVGLWVTKQFRPIRKVIHLGRVVGLDRVEAVEDAIIIGAAATYEQAQTWLASIDPDIGNLLRRLGSRQVRASGTVGGNIANGSPIGDMPPVLIALGATLELVYGSEVRAIPLEDFFIAYGKQDREAGEFVAGVLVPRLAAGQVFRAYKIAKRFDQDISSVLGAFRFTIDQGVITEARVAFGGMAATPKRAMAVEAALKKDGFAAAIAAVETEFKPIDDWRGSAAYRLQAAKNLLRRLELRVASPGQAVEVEAL